MVKQALGGTGGSSSDYSNGGAGATTGGGLKHGFGDEKANGANGATGMGPAASAQAQGGGGADPEKGKFSGRKPAENSKTKKAGGAELDPRAFDHPSTYDDLNPVWVPNDSFGMGNAAIRDLRAAGIDATDEGAEMDDKGGVHITRSVASLPVAEVDADGRDSNPPGEDELIELPADDPK